MLVGLRLRTALIAPVRDFRPDAPAVGSILSTLAHIGPLQIHRQKYSSKLGALFLRQTLVGRCRNIIWGRARTSTLESPQSQSLSSEFGNFRRRGAVSQQHTPATVPGGRAPHLRSADTREGGLLRGVGRALIPKIFTLVGSKSVSTAAG